MTAPYATWPALASAADEDQAVSNWKADLLVILDQLNWLETKNGLTNTTLASMATGDIAHMKVTMSGAGAPSGQAYMKDAIDRIRGASGFNIGAFTWSDDFPVFNGTSDTDEDLVVRVSLLRQMRVAIGSVFYRYQTIGQGGLSTGSGGPSSWMTYMSSFTNYPNHPSFYSAAKGNTFEGEIFATYQKNILAFLRFDTLILISGDWGGQCFMGAHNHITGCYKNDRGRTLTATEANTTGFTFSSYNIIYLATAGLVINNDDLFNDLSGLALRSYPCEDPGTELTLAFHDDGGQQVDISSIVAVNTRIYIKIRIDAAAYPGIPSYPSGGGAQPWADTNFQFIIYDPDHIEDYDDVFLWCYGQDSGASY